MLSILTNFGCHWSCPYCVYRENGINIQKTTKETFDFKALENEIKNMQGDEISISGGGDPLYKFEENQWFYNEIWDLAQKYDKKLELHTTYIDYNIRYDWFERVVFHVNSPTQIRLIDSSKMHLPDNVRLVFVLQEHYNRALINHIAKEINLNLEITELVSFRQLIGKDGLAVDIEGEFLKEGHMKKWYYIEQCDYNDYFVVNRIEKEYLEIK